MNLDFIKKYDVFLKKIKDRFFYPSLETRIDFYESMADAVSQNLPQMEVLKVLEKEYKRAKNPMWKIIAKVLARLHGNELGSGLRQKSVGTELLGLLPNQEVSLIISGESSGLFEKGWRNAARQAKQVNEIKGKILGLLAKPVLYLAAFIGLLIFFSIKVIPQFDAVKPRSQWSAEAQLLGTVSDNIYLIVTSLSVGISLLFILFMVLLKHWTSPLREVADKKFPFFSMMAQLNCATFMNSLAAFSSAGVSFEESLQKISQTASPYLKWQIKKVQRALRLGLRPEASLQRMSMMPVSYYWILSLYGMLSSSDVSNMYEKIAEQMTKRAMKRMEFVLGTVLSNIMMLLLGVAIIWVYSSIYGIVEQK